MRFLIRFISYITRRWHKPVAIVDSDEDDVIMAKPYVDAPHHVLNLDKVKDHDKR